MGHPSIIFRNKFVYNWHISGDNGVSGGDFIDYMLRPQAFNPDYHRCTTDQFYCFEEFMQQNEVSDGAFSMTEDKMNLQQLEEVRKLERNSRENGCPKYIGVISFNNDVLRENNILVGNNLNVQKIKEATRIGMAEMIASSDKLSMDNCYWVASIHSNTEHIHVHYQLLEKNRLVDRKKESKGKDKIELKAMKKLKSSMMYNIDKSDLSEKLTKFERDVLQRTLKYNFAADITKIENLIAKLPTDRGWQYNRLRKSTKNEVDSCIRCVINSNENTKKDFEDYLKGIGASQIRFKNNYGDKSHFADYKMSRLHGKDGFYSRVGNQFLNLCKEYKKTGNIDTNKIQMPEKFSLSKNITEMTDKSSTDENKSLLQSFDIQMQSYDNIGNLINDDTETYDPFSVYEEYQAEAEAYLSEKEIESYDEPPVLDSYPINDYQPEAGAYLSKKEIEGYDEPPVLDSYPINDYPPQAGAYLSEKEIESLDVPPETDGFPAGDYPPQAVTYLSEKEIGTLDVPPETDGFPAGNYPTQAEAYLSKNKNEKNEPQPHIAWSKEYKAALDYLYGNEKNKIEKNPQKALELLTAESDTGNILATYDVGKMYANEIVKVDEHRALSDKYYSQALSDFNELLNKDIFLLESKTDKKLSWEVSYLHYRIGKMYDRGLGTEQDYETARLHYEQANENKYALFSLGNMYKYGNGVEIDPAKAFEYYQHSESCKGGMPYASYNLGQAYEIGDGVEQSDEKAKSKYFAALNGFINIFAKNPDDSTSYKIGYMYFYGKGTEIDYEQAEEYLIKSAEVNNLDAQCLLGKLYLTDEKQNYELAEKYLKISADKDNFYAQYSLGKFNQMENYNDFDKAEKYLVLSAENAADKNGLGAYALGKLYMCDEMQDYKLAEKYLKVAAKKNNQFAQFALGKYYLSLRDKREAYKYFKKSADNGNVLAMYNAGKILLENNAETDRKTALKLMDAAIENDCEFACFYVGKYFSQFNDNKSKSLAEKYLLKSAIDFNDSNAQLRLGKAYLSENKNEQAAIFLKMSAVNGNTNGQLAYGLFLYKRGERLAGRAWIQKSAKSGNKFAGQILQGKTSELPLSYQLQRAASAQKTLLHKSSNMLRNAIKAEQAKTARLIREFEFEQEMARAKENRKKSV